jgi:predicted DNA-binding transcriptional regulator AlpA
MGDFPIPATHHLDRRAAKLAEVIDGSDDTIVRTPVAAEVLGMSQQWLESGRHAGYGPRFIKLSARGIGYRLGDLRQYLKERSRHYCTSEYLPRKRKKA